MSKILSNSEMLRKTHNELHALKSKVAKARRTYYYVISKINTLDADIDGIHIYQLDDELNLTLVDYYVGLSTNVDDSLYFVESEFAPFDSDDAAIVAFLSRNVSEDGQFEEL